jgi:hypothetical protein
VLDSQSTSDHMRAVMPLHPISSKAMLRRDYELSSLIADRVIVKM